MPPVKRPYRPVPGHSDVERFEQALKEVEDEDALDFIRTCKRSDRNNLTRQLENGTRITIFFRRAAYRLCIVEDGFAPWYPEGGYESEREAVKALLRMFDDGNIEWRTTDYGFRDLVG